MSTSTIQNLDTLHERLMQVEEKIGSGVPYSLQLWLCIHRRDKESHHDGRQLDKLQITEHGWAQHYPILWEVTSVLDQANNSTDERGPAHLPLRI